MHSVHFRVKRKISDIHLCRTLNRDDGSRIYCSGKKGALKAEWGEKKKHTQRRE